MSLFNRDEEFINALRKYPEQRTTKDLEIIFSRLHRFEALSNLREQSLRNLCAKVRYERHVANEILYRKDDTCSCWFILLSGSIFIQGSMFLRNTCFGKQIPGTKVRGCQCLVLEPSEMIAIDYPEMHHPLHGNSVSVSNLRKHSSGSKSMLDSVAEADNSSAENSPKQNVSRRSSAKMRNGQATTVKSGSAIENSKDAQDYFINEDSVSQDGLDQDDRQSEEEEEEHEDSISLHSSSSLVIKDLVTDVLKRDPSERNEDDHDVLLEFTRSLQAFSNMTEPIRRALCKVMVFAQAEKEETMLLRHNELLDSWSVIINGYVRIEYPNDEETEATKLYMGESFGVEPNMQPQHHKGVMFTGVDDCQFVCVAQQDYCEVLLQGKENMENVMGEDGAVKMITEKREIEGGRNGNIVIRGTPSSLRSHLLEENSIDTTYAEDYLLTYRAFSNEPVEICKQLLAWLDKDAYQAKVTRVILLWINNHFNDFEGNTQMMELLEKFEEKLQKCNKKGECRLFNIACSTKAKSRVVTLSRTSKDGDMGFSINGGTENYPIYILQVELGSVAEQKGLKRGDQLLNVNGQNFEKLNREKANAILQKNTDLTLTIKTNLFAFKEMMSDLEDPNKKKDKKKLKHDAPFISQISTMQPTRPSRMPSLASDVDMYDGKARKAGTLGRRALVKMNKVRTKMFQTKKEQSFKDYLDIHHGTISDTGSMAKDDSFLSAMRTISGAATIDGPHSFKQAAAHSSSNPDLLDPGAYLGPELPTMTEVPEDVIKVFKADQTYKFLFVSQDTTAEEAIRSACKEFSIPEESYENYSLCKVTVQNETFVKQSKLPDKLSNLSEIPLSARYYLKNNLESEQLLPDENIPDVLKEANYSFLDLNCFELALHLTLQDYEHFKTVEQTDFIDDLFNLNEESLVNFKLFENLVNRELFWVASTICSEPNLMRRFKMIKHFTKVAQYCKALKNLNSTFAIISGLGYRAVARMKSSWEKVPAKVQRTFDDLQALMDPSRNMSKYRTLLNDLTAQPPVLPYIPVVKKDLTFLHLGNDTKVDSLINFEKMRMIGREVRNVCRLCSADSSQIISSAVAHHPDAERPSSNIYHTLTRKGRRSSFNNARKMYEDAMNARRVKQYMLQLEVETDEDKLMEMSKQVEPASVSSGQPKRKNLPSDSPSRTSKTLPGGPNSSTANAMKRQSQGRNNSEPQITLGSGVLSQPARKKNPVSSLPKFGTTSPQAISKLLALSEESGDGGSSGSSKRGSLEQKRSGSTSSRELSPATSPYLSPRRDIGRSKASISSSDSGHSVAHENTNRNNNRGRRDIPPSLTRSMIHSKHLSHPSSLASYSNSSSARSSIASSSSLGMSTSSLNAPPGLSSSSSSHSLSPRSSPNPSSSAWDHLNRTQRTFFHNSPVRSNSSSSTDTVKSADPGHPPSDRPVIMQNRTGSFGALSVTTVKPDCQMASNPGDRRLTGYSTATLAAANKHHLILPNHPQIPRSPSIDSGVIGIGSHSADSTRFLHAGPGELFPGPAHRSSASLSSSEGYASQQSLQLADASSKNDSPVMRRHLRNKQLRQDGPGKTATRVSEVGEAIAAHKPPTEQQRQNQTEGPDAEDDIKQAFLSGSRGWGDAPQSRHKDPWPIEAAMLPPGVVTTRPANWQTHAPGDITASIGGNRNYSWNAQQHNAPPPPRPREFKGGGDVIDGRFHHHSPQKQMATGSGPEIQQYYNHLRSQERPNPPATLNFRSGSSRQCDAKTPDSILGDKYPPELHHQRQRMNRSFDGVPTYYQTRNNGEQMFCERHSASFSGVSPGYRDSLACTPGSPAAPTLPVLHRQSMEKSDQPFRHPGTSPYLPAEYPKYPSPSAVCTKPGCKCPASRQMVVDPRSHHQVINFNLHGSIPSQRQNSVPYDMRGRVPVRRDGEDVYLSDFGNPDPRTFMRVPPEHQSVYRHPRMPDEGPQTVPPFHCPKHGNPYISPHKGYAPPNSQSLQGVPQFSSLPLPPPLASAPDTPTSRYRAETHYEYGHTPVEMDRHDGHNVVHTRSSSDVSLHHTSGYDFDDQYNKNNSNNSLDDVRYVNGSIQAFPSPIVDGYADRPRYKVGQFQDTSSPFQSSAQANSSTPISQPRRKSSEWAVTDLDKENQQQAMQVWSSGSSSTISAASPNVSVENKPTVLNTQSNPTEKRKKPPPPLPPQRNSSYGVTRQLRLSSSTLSPLSSPPNSPTNPVSHTKISLNETHPQLVVKTMANGIQTRAKPLSQSNGIPPQMTQPSMNCKEAPSSSPTRALPSYNEAISHISSNSSFSPTNTKLPSYQAYQEMRDIKDQTSQV